MKAPCLAAMALGITLSSVAFGQANVLDPRYEISQTLPNPPGVAPAVCDILFTEDGSQVYMNEDCENDYGSIYILDVLRDGSGQVTGFGPAVPLATLEDQYFDAGIALAPNGTTLLFYLYDFGFGQHALGSGTILEDDEITGYDSDYGGLDLLPAGPNAGDIIHSETNGSLVWRHPISDNGDGTYAIDTDGVLWADLSGVAPVDTHDLGDIEFIQRGPFAGQAMVAMYTTGPGDPVRNSLAVFGVDAAGNADLSDVRFVLEGVGGAWGLEQDPVTGDLWISDYDEDQFVVLTESGLDENGNPILVPIPTNSTLGLVTLGALLLMLAGVARRRV